MQTPSNRAAELIQLLGLERHPEGGWYREIHRSASSVDPLDGRSRRASLTTIDFLLVAGEHSAWHQVASDEVWHLLEGGPLRLWLMSPAGEVSERVLGRASGSSPSVATPRAVVPAGWWQAAEPVGPYAYVGATVAPGFEFADFRFLRDDPAARVRLAAQSPQAARLL
jgi:predicted cupin superfamily sugar epimerase